MLSDRCLSVCLSVMSVLSLTVYCGQTFGSMKMKLSLQVGLDPGHTVLDGDPAPPPHKGAEPPSYRFMSIVAKRLDESRWNLAQMWDSVQSTLC